jgi:DNA-binding response OmpR family regulator
VEDDTLVGETILAMLDGICEATLVSDGMAAMEAVEANPSIAVIILDCLLPGGGGLRLLDLADTRRVPVIMTSGSSAEMERIGKSRPSLAKPFSSDKMIALVRAAAAGKRPG